VTELESLIPIDAQAQGMDDITPEQLAEVLSILTGGEFTPDGLLSNAHALMVLAPDDPRCERLYLAVLHAHEAAENGNRRAIIRHEMELTVELLRLKPVSCQKGIPRCYGVPGCFAGTRVRESHLRRRVRFSMVTDWGHSAQGKSATRFLFRPADKQNCPNGAPARNTLQPFIRPWRSFSAISFASSPRIASPMVYVRFLVLICTRPIPLGRFSR
jgi:hypothetical protein